jgi:hypothetical protein
MNKKPSDQAEMLARQLQEKLQRQRPRWLRWVPLLAAVVLGVLGIAAWVLYPAPDPPRLTVTALDALGVRGEPAEMRGYLDPVEPDAETTNLAGRNIAFWIEKTRPVLDDLPRRQSVSDAAGSATLTLDPGDLDRVAFFARHIDSNKKYEAKDRAHIHLVAQKTPLLMVEVEETLADLDPKLWSSTHPSAIPVRAVAGAALKIAHEKHGYQIVYLALETTPAREYRRVRGWVEQKGSAPDALPVGPVLGRLRYESDDVSHARHELASQLRQRFTGPLVAVVRTAEAAEQYRALGIRPVAMGGGDFPAGVTPIQGWAELNEVLGK